MSTPPTVSCRRMSASVVASMSLVRANSTIRRRGARISGAPPGRGDAPRSRLTALVLARCAPGQILLDQVHHRGVGQRRHVAELAVLGDIAEQPAHDLAGPGL